MYSDVLLDFNLQVFTLRFFNTCHKYTLAYANKYFKVTVKPVFYTLFAHHMFKTVQMLFMLKHPDLKNLKCNFRIRTRSWKGLMFCFSQLPFLWVYFCPCLCVSVQKPLKILQPAFLEEFLVAVEGFGAFCTGPELQELMLLSDSVKNQWEVWQGLSPLCSFY